MICMCKADAVCSVTCAYMSLTLLAGLLLNRFFGWWWADPLAALVIVYYGIREAVHALHESREMPLTDTARKDL